MSHQFQKVILFIFAISVVLLFTGYNLYERLGLFVALVVSLAFSFIFLFFGENRIPNYFKIQKIEGQDAYNLKYKVQNLSRQLSLPTVDIYIFESSIVNGFYCENIFSGSGVYLSTELLKTFSNEEVEATLALLVTHLYANQNNLIFILNRISMGIANLALSSDRFFSLKRPSPVLKASFIYKILSPLIWLIQKISLSFQTQYDTDHSSLVLYRKPNVTSVVLWKLQGYQNTSPIDLPLNLRTYFLISPKDETKTLFSLQSKVSQRIKKMAGTYPV